MTFVEGTVVDIIYRNEDNAYTVLELDYEGALLVCVGNIPFIQPGEYVRFYGAYTTHKSLENSSRSQAWRAGCPRETRA